MQLTLFCYFLLVFLTLSFNPYDIIIVHVDASQKLESEGHCEDLKLVSSAPGTSESNPASPNRDASGGSFVARDSSVKSQAANDEEAFYRSPGNLPSPVQEKHIPAVERSSESLINKESTVSLEKMPSSDDLENTKNLYHQAHGSGQSHLSPGDSICFENTTPLQNHNEEIMETSMVEGSQTVGKPDGILEKEVSCLQPKAKLKIPEDSSLSR